MEDSLNISQFVGSSVVDSQIFFSDERFLANRTHKVSLPQVDLLDVAIYFPFAEVLVIARGTFVDTL